MSQVRSVGLLEIAKLFVFKWLCGGDFKRYMSLRAKAVKLAAELNIYERPHLLFLRTYLREGDFAVDVGANLGAYSIAMAQSVGSTGRLLSFEPMPQALELLRKNTNNFTQVTTFNIALSDITGQSEFRVPLLFGGIPEISLGGLEVSSKDSKVFTVSTTRLDNYISELDRLRFVKVDIEGAEMAFLRGAEEVIARYRPLIQFEANPETTQWDLIKAFAINHEYDICAIKDQVLVEASGEHKKAQNFYLKPR